MPKKHQMHTQETISKNKNNAYDENKLILDFLSRLAFDHYAKAKIESVQPAKSSARPSTTTLSEVGHHFITRETKNPVLSKPILNFLSRPAFDHHAKAKKESV